MKRIFIELASIFGLALLSQTVRADALKGKGGAFQPWTSAVLGPVGAPTYGGPYWNNFSPDGPAANIGWCLVGTGGCVIASPPGAISYYGNGTAAVSNMYYQNNGTPVTVSLLAMYTNQLGTPKNTGYNVFGWYEINSNGTIGAMTALWNSKSATIGETATFVPTGSYGLYLENIQGNGQADYFWFMNKGQDYSAGPDKNPIDSTQHFAIFSGTPGQYFVGMDDTDGGALDYNDMIVKVTNAPEPSAFVLSGLGLLCGFRFARSAKSRPARAQTV
jgi:hypothetical protein